MVRPIGSQSCWPCKNQSVTVNATQLLICQDQLSELLYTTMPRAFRWQGVSHSTRLGCTSSCSWYLISLVVSYSIARMFNIFARMFNIFGQKFLQTIHKYSPIMVGCSSSSSLILWYDQSCGTSALLFKKKLIFFLNCWIYCQSNSNLILGSGHHSCTCLPLVLQHVMINTCLLVPYATAIAR